MADPQKVVLALAEWSDEFRPLLARVASGPAWADGIVAAIKRGDAPLMVARVPGGPPLGLVVLSFQSWPVPYLYVHAMAAVPKSGFRWGPAFLPPILALAQQAGASGVRAEAPDGANARRLRRLGFKDFSVLMVARC